jgi:hypothetical protein
LQVEVRGAELRREAGGSTLDQAVRKESFLVTRHRKRSKATYRILADQPEPTIVVLAGSWRRLLEAAAQGVATLLHQQPTEIEPSSGQMFPIELHRTDFDTMLTAWLDELLHQSGSHHLLPRRFEILQLDLEADCKLTAMIEGVSMPSDWRPSLHSVVAPLPRTRQTKDGLTCEIHFRPAAS